MSEPDETRKTVLITGAGRRIGRAIALHLAGHGWRVGVHYHSSAEAAEEVVRVIRDQGGEAAALGADLADSGQCATLVNTCAETFSPPLCLINNASIYEDDTLADMSPTSWQRHLDINLRAPVLLAQAFARALPKDEAGNIINLLDQRVWRLTPHFFSYTISKSALWTATRTMAQTLAPRIRVNAIGPGPVLPNPYQTDEEFAEEWRSTLLGRGATPEEIARAVLFILDMPAMTGQMIALDGGQHLA